jgi:hypothetical protein
MAVRKPQIVDKILAREIELFAENEYKMYQRLLDIQKNYSLKRKRGTWDKSKAIKGLVTMYVNPSISEYRRQFGLGSVNSATKNYIAKNVFDYLWSEMGLKNVKKSRKKK